MTLDRAVTIGKRWRHSEYRSLAFFHTLDAFLLSSYQVTFAESELERFIVVVSTMNHGAVFEGNGLVDVDLGVKWDETARSIGLDVNMHAVRGLVYCEGGQSTEELRNHFYIIRLIMDFFFNYFFIPRSTATMMVIRPAGKTFITGLARSYQSTYDEDRLGKHISEKDFQSMMTHLNNVVSTFWPCPCSIVFGYLFSPFTLGLSFLLPNLCMHDAREALLKAIYYQNNVILNKKGLELEYKSSWSTSWMELRVLSEEEMRLTEET